ncbi:CmpA/NrtA family ABC transporter substrate-binding protein [Shimia biformata]|uniref:CmpA/NrtA family ABC transporter substrate-binding protein n=1 Tax=Shimia biformata TaxID=1294299 RepID=UPI00194F0012|nr:CmpA/NrtA family ABC transporter substrate-binding protein [Shimia biformata]
MTRPVISAGFIPLVDAAPLIVAHEMGFTEEEGIRLALEPSPSWSTLRDKLTLGQIEAAHMLSPVPVAMALGLGGIGDRIDALSVLSVNGNVFGVTEALADAMIATGFTPDFATPEAVGDALAASGLDLRIGVPFPFSMHTELLHRWLGTGPNAAQLTVHTVPPPLMAEAIKKGEINAFCVGEPWGSTIVDAGLGALLLPGRAIWAFAPEKVLAARHDWVEAQPDLTGRLMRAVWKAGRWLGDTDKLGPAADILARPEYLGLPSGLIERSLTGRMVIAPDGPARRVENMITFFDGAATFPWKSQAAWIGRQLAARYGLNPHEAASKAADVFRSDLYRLHLGPAGADMPGASEKLEGALSVETPVASESGTLILGPDQFFDGQIFDPSLGK